jgi:adenylate cyclase class IV
MLVTIDHVSEIGKFAEVECIVESAQGLAAAEQAIQSAANSLGLSFMERRSYLSMVLEQQK